MVRIPEGQPASIGILFIAKDGFPPVSLYTQLITSVSLTVTGTSDGSHIWMQTPNTNICQTCYTRPTELAVACFHIQPFLNPSGRGAKAAACRVKIERTRSTSRGSTRRWMASSARACAPLLTSAERPRDPSRQRGFTDWRCARPQPD